MEGIRVYKEMLVTYGELAHALTQLGFVEDTTSPHFHYINEKKKSAALLKKHPADRIVAKINLAGLSYQLYIQGILKHTDDLAKRIEKNRLPKKTKKSVAVPQ
jgi:predicted DNA binding CopG/RHH family protein